MIRRRRPTAPHNSPSSRTAPTAADAETGQVHKLDPPKVDPDLRRKGRILRYSPRESDDALGATKSAVHITSFPRARKHERCEGYESGRTAVTNLKHEGSGRCPPHEWFLRVSAIGDGLDPSAARFAKVRLGARLSVLDLGTYCFGPVPWSSGLFRFRSMAVQRFPHAIALSASRSTSVRCLPCFQFIVEMTLARLLVL